MAGGKAVFWFSSMFHELLELMKSILLHVNIMLTDCKGAQEIWFLWEMTSA